MKFQSTSFSSSGTPMQGAIPGQQPMRQFDVGAPEAVPPQQFIPQQPAQSASDLEAQLRTAREAKVAQVSGEARLDPEAKKRIEFLSGIGRLTKEVKMGDTTFVLRTLKQKEAKEASVATFAVPRTGLEISYEARKQQLARAICYIDGHTIDTVIGSNSMEDRLYWIEENLEDIVVDHLFSEFEKLKEEAKVKYGIKTEKDIKEVVEDLKK